MLRRASPPALLEAGRLQYGPTSSSMSLPVLIHSLVLIECDAGGNYHSWGFLVGITNWDGEVACRIGGMFLQKMAEGSPHERWSSGNRAPGRPPDGDFSPWTTSSLATIRRCSHCSRGSVGLDRSHDVSSSLRAADDSHDVSSFLRAAYDLLES